MVVISRNNISWTITGSPTNGTYITGDPWVVGPIEITAIAPAPGGSPYQNGTMKNIRGNETEQGHFDIGGGGVHYSAGLSMSLPANLVAGDMIVSSTYTAYGSLTAYSGHSALSYCREMACLTVVSSPPAAGSFRPNYAGPNKMLFNTSQIDWSRVPALSKTGTTIDAAMPGIKTTLDTTWGRCWYDHGNGWYSRDWRPTYNMEDYGYDISTCVNDTVWWLSLDYTQVQKEPILYGLIQYGIDLFGLWKDGREWDVNGGQNLGRLLPMLIAGYVLNDAAMMAPLSRGFPGQRIQEIQDTYFATSNSWFGGRSLRKGHIITNWEQIEPGAGWGVPPYDSQYMWCCNWNAYTATALLCRIWGISKNVEHWSLFSCAERWMNPMSSPMHTAWDNVPNANGSSAVPSVGTTSSSFTNDAWTRHHNTYHHLPDVTRHIGTSSNAELILNAPIPLNGGSYTFEVYRCPWPDGEILIGPKLATPIVTGNATLWVDPNNTIMKIPFTRNQYFVASVTATLPSFSGLNSFCIQARWLG